MCIRDRVTQTANKVYNGTPLTAGGSIDGFVEGETATFTVTGSQTEVGYSPNTYHIEWDKTAKAKNYEIDESVGELTVTENKAEIVVTTQGGTFTYTGTEPVSYTHLDVYKRQEIILYKEQLPCRIFLCI